LKLIRLLLELNAAEKAREMGLQSMSFGRYGKDGVVTHRVVDDKLLPVKGDEDNTKNPRANDQKPDSMDAKTAGTKPSNNVTPKDVEKSQEKPAKGYGDLNADDEKKDEKDDKEGGEGEQEGPQPVAPNPFTAKPFSFGHPVDPNIISNVTDRNDWRSKELIAGEQVIECSSDELIDFLLGYNDEDYEYDKVATNAAKEQNVNWRNQLDPVLQDELLEVQTTWQTESQYHLPASQRRQQNLFLNAVTSGPPPATLNNIQRPIERGMTVEQNDAEEFLKTFRVGEDIELPPSGFSTRPSIARSYANGGTAKSQDIGVVLRLAPNRQGKIHGLALFGVDPSHEDIIRYRDKPDLNYGEESEVIRPSGPKARCTNVSKLLSKDENGRQRVCYVIDMEEQGYKELAIAEAYDDWGKKNKINPVFERLMNTPLGSRPLAPMQANEIFLVRLLNSLNEGNAADQAHKMGLVHHGGPYWSKDGKVVAKTVSDKLVKVTPEEAKQVETGATKTPLDKSDAAANDEWDETNTESLEGNGDDILGKLVMTNTAVGGTNEGGIYKGKDGLARYVKFYQDGNMAECEALADDLYNRLGITAPDAEYFEHNGKSAFAALMMPVEEDLATYVKKKGMTKEIAMQIVQGFAVDCLLANWDVVGVNEGFMRNIVLLKDFGIARIDNGSALLHRGLNGRKKELGPDVLFKMSEPEKFVTENPSYSQVFKALGITDYKQLGQEFVQQVSKIVKLHNEIGGWQKYVESRIPSMNPTDKADIVKMLYERTKQLIDRAKEIETT
jgi:hypothetical protein